MGMAAGQARLLSITARLSDNEQRGQSISYAKERLADQTDQINRAYNEALNSTKLTMLTGFNGAEPQYTDISYDLLTSYKTSDIVGKQYLVTDARGKILVTKDIKDAFEQGNGDFNIFLEELGYSQNDVNFTSTSLTNDEKAQYVHDAWDKYLKSVGLSFYDTEHDTENPGVKFNWNTNGHPEVLLSRHKITFNDIYNIFTENKNDIKQQTINQEYIMGGSGLIQYQRNDDGEYVPVFEVMIDTDPAENISTYVTYQIYKGNSSGEYYITANGQFLKDSANNQLKLKAEDVNVDVIKEENPVCIHYPLNYEGTTDAQRELYDYAVALTKAKYNADNGVTPSTSSIADDPENIAAVKHYRNIFNQMAQFGYITEADLNIIQSAQSGVGGVVTTGIKDNNWFEKQLRQGTLLLKTYDSSKGAFVTTTYAEDSNIQEVPDERKIAQAEVEYTQAQEALERKDKKFDLELKRLDTEHNALQTEYDAIKGVVDKNVEKTFQIFS